MKETDHDAEQDPGHQQQLQNLALLGKDIATAFGTLIGNEQSIIDTAFSSADWKYQFERFGLWADNLGLYHRGHSSLDYRLREAEPLQEFIRCLLIELKEVLSDFLNATLLAKQAEDSTSPYPPSSPSESASSSESEFSEGEYLADYQDEPWIAVLLKSATDIIDRLYKFASRIRNPATRLASAKAKAFKNVDAETGVELYENFETQIDPQHINEVFSEYRHKGAPGDDAQSDDSEKADQLEDLTEADRTLIARFAKANTDRRRQFGYWRRHRVKNTRETIKALEEVAKMPDFAPSLGKMPIAISNVLPPPTSKLYSRPSTATQLLLDPSKFNFNDTASTRSSHTIAPKAQNAKDEQVDVPEVPSSLKGQDNFSCPYCFTLCSKSILEKERWREHIFRDLRPYMCTYADCKTGDQCYDSWKDWIAHEQWSHNKVWQCLLHPEETFTIWAELETHLKKAHAITDDISDTDKKAMIQESTSNVVERACPFCLLATKSLEALQMHVATHLQRIALFALPRSTDIHDGSSAGEEGHSGQANKEFDDSRQGDIDDHGDSTRVEERDLMQCNSCEHIWYQEASELGCFECSSNDITVLESGGNKSPIDAAKEDNAKSVERLCRAAKEGDTTMVERFLKGNLSIIDMKGRVGRTPFSCACKRGHERIARLLLATGRVDLSSRDNWQKTPLALAAEKGHQAIVELLLETGQVDIDASDGNVETPLGRAIRNGHESIARLLLASNHVNPNHRNQDEETPLLQAAMNGHNNIVRLLLDTDRVDVNAADSRGLAPLSYAAANGHEDVVKSLLEIPEIVVDHKDSEGHTPLLLVCSGTEIQRQYIIKELLATGRANPNYTDHTGQTALSLAAGIGNLDIIKLLLQESEVDPDHKDMDGQTPLTKAAKFGRDKAVGILLGNLRVVEDTMDKSGRRPLSYAAELGHDKVVGIYIEHSETNPYSDENIMDQPDSDGRTPFSRACGEGKETVARMLLEKGNIVLNSADQTGRTPLSFAAEYGRVTIVKILVGQPHIMLDTPDVKGRTPLFHAARTGNVSVVQILLDTGEVDPLRNDASRDTPLSIADKNGHESVWDRIHTRLHHPNDTPESSDNNEDPKVHQISRILAERESEGSTEYLVIGKGQPLPRSTWKPESILLSSSNSRVLTKWRARKIQISEGAVKPFDIKVWERAVEDMIPGFESKRTPKEPIRDERPRPIEALEDKQEAIPQHEEETLPLPNDATLPGVALRSSSQDILISSDRIPASNAIGVYWPQWEEGARPVTVLSLYNHHRSPNFSNFQVQARNRAERKFNYAVDLDEASDFEGALSAYKEAQSLSDLVGGDVDMLRLTQLCKDRGLYLLLGSPKFEKVKPPPPRVPVLDMWDETLGFVKGDVIKVLEPRTKDWWIGVNHRTDMAGKFPTNHVTVTEVNTALPRLGHDRRDSPIVVAKDALSTPSNPGANFAVGDKLVVERRLFTDWWYGYNLRNGVNKDSPRGLFPADAVEDYTIHFLEEAWDLVTYGTMGMTREQLYFIVRLKLLVPIHLSWSIVNQLIMAFSATQFSDDTHLNFGELDLVRRYLQAWYGVFNYYSANGVGIVSLRQFKDYLDDAGYRLGKANAKGLYDNFAEDRHDGLTFENFLSAQSSLKQCAETFQRHADDRYECAIMGFEEFLLAIFSLAIANQPLNLSFPPEGVKKIDLRRERFRNDRVIKLE